MRSLLITVALGATLGPFNPALAQFGQAGTNRPAVRLVVQPETATANVSTNAGVLELLREVEALKREVQSLRGQVETRGYEVEQLRNQLTAVYTDLDRRLQSVQGGAPSAQPPLPMLAPTPGGEVAGTPAPESTLLLQPAPPAGDAVPPAFGAPPAPARALDSAGDALLSTPPASLNPPPPTLLPPTLLPPALAPAGTAGAAPTADDASSEAAYREAFGLLRAGEYDQAIASFNNFQSQYPDSQYGDNAQYWLAEAYYTKNDFAAAIAEYQKMLAQYPASRKLSHAMLKIGYSYDKLGKPQEARAVLAELVAQYPDSAAGHLAQERIAQIDRGAPR
ncbi:MAG: tol-pal system protein YbgF [Gammaproteobacteria bacterium]|nr:tol-pal system protein YbgF [Gammaproteobacteria bacterium]